MKLPARSALHDESLATLLAAIEVAPVEEVDWAKLYAGSLGAKPFLGAVEARQLPGQGLGLVASRPVKAGEVLLLERAWATSRTRGAASGVALAELADACARKLRSADVHERAVFWCLHGGKSEEDAWQRPELRLAAFRRYLRQMRGFTDPDLQLPAPPDQVQSAVSSRVASNSRRSETWNAHTLLLDETHALGGLWFAASLFNHSCCANITLSYALSKDGPGLQSSAVARAAIQGSLGTWTGCLKMLCFVH